MTLKTRQPTGAVPWPLTLVEGGEKSGRTWACALLTRSPKVGRCLWIDFGEGRADEYGAIPGVKYEVVVHDGTWASFYGAVVDASEAAGKAQANGEPPVVLIIDNMTAVWDLLCEIARARAATSRSNRAKLRDDPHAEITVTSNYWNDVHEMHKQLMAVLKRFEGIVLMVANGKPVTVFKDGQPVEGKKEHKVDADRALAGAASCWVRLSRDEPPTIVGCVSVHYGIRPGIDAPRRLPDDWSFERLIFDVLKCDPHKTRARPVVETDATIIEPKVILNELLNSATTVERVRELGELIVAQGYQSLLVINERKAEEEFLQLARRTYRERSVVPAQAVSVEVVRDVPAADETEIEAMLAAEAWMTSATKWAATFADDNAGRKLWAEVVTRKNGQAIAAADADRLKELIKARWQELTAKAAEGAVVEPLDPADPWAAKVEEIASADDAAAVQQEALRAFGDKPVDAAKTRAVMAAIATKAATFEPVARAA
jgi:hypothetical protein